VGMLFDPAVLLDRPLQVLAVTLIIVTGKSIAALLLVLAMRYPLSTALTVSTSLAQIGEFSFILIALGTSLAVVPAEASSLVVAGALLSMAMNPLFFSLNEPLRRWILKRSALARRLDTRDDPYAALPQSTESRYLAKHVVLAGYGVVGRVVAEAMAARNVPFVVIEQNRERVQRLRERGWPAVSGDVSDPMALVQAHVAQAGLLVIAVSDTTEVRPMIENARELNPGIPIVVRAGSEEEAALLQKEGLERVLHAKGALGEAMADAVVEAIDRMPPRVATAVSGPLATHGA
jgi:CPA2 family monovalent cation:H+ antiporter-2